jgi:phage antirepressor YoqD-like protein
MAKVEKVLGKDAPKFLGTSLYKGNGSAMLERKIYNFPKREATLMAMSYSHEISAQVYDRMEALEKEIQGNVTQFQVPKSFHEALLLAANQQKQIEDQQLEIAEKQQALTLAAPKVKFHDNFVKGNNTYNATAIAKKLGVSAYTLNSWLVAQGAMYQNRKHLRQWYIDQGYGVEKFVDAGEYAGIYQQVRHTSAGANWILQNFDVNWRGNAKVA